MRASLPVALVLVALLTAPGLVASTPVVLVPEEGPVLPAVTSPTVATAHDGVVWSHTAHVQRDTILVPDMDVGRVIVVLTIDPAGDPWDRLFGVAIGDVEVLRGTTPRVSMTIREDVTRYASLLPRGDAVEVRTRLDSWVGALVSTLRFEFYPADEPTSAGVEAPYDHALGAFQWRGHCANGGRLSSMVQFPDAASSRGVVELTTTGHGGQLFIPPPGPPNSWSEEFWYAHSPTPRVFHVLVDGEEVATAVAMPYVYALAGFSSQGGGSTNTAVWWTAQKLLNLAGVHTGAGQIPAYRMTLAPDALPLLTGERVVELYAENGACVWITSVAFLLDA